MGTSLNKSMDIQAHFRAHNISSAWIENHQFANWLTQRKKPAITVELGVDWGYSLFALSEFNPGNTFGVDLFTGDDHAGARDWSSQYKLVTDFIIENNLYRTHLIRGDFHAVAAAWNLPIDLLHIDGLHTYDAVRNDWNSWAPKLTPTSVSIFHDTVSFEGPRRLIQEIKDQTPSLCVGNFQNAAGLGLVTYDRELFDEIKQTYANFVELEAMVPLTGIEPAEPSPSN